MNQHTCDLVVIGAGPGGYVAAIRASQLGLKTICVEKADLGGICLNWGCIPTKALLKNAEYMNFMKHAGEFGFEIPSFTVDFPKVIKRSREVSSKMSAGIGFLFKKNKVESTIMIVPKKAPILSGKVEKLSIPSLANLIIFFQV